MVCNACPLRPVASRLGFRTPVTKDTGTTVDILRGAWRVGDGGDGDDGGLRWTTVVTTVVMGRLGLWPGSLARDGAYCV